MDLGVSVALSTVVLYLIVSSKYVCTLMKSTLGLTDDMALLARAALFGLLVFGKNNVLYHF